MIEGERPFQLIPPGRLQPPPPRPAAGSNASRFIVPVVVPPVMGQLPTIAPIGQVVTPGRR